MPYPAYVRPNGNGTPVSSSGVQIPPVNEPRQQEAVNRLDEKVRSATLSGRLSFLPYLDPYTEETNAMRRMYPIMLRNPVVKQSLQHKVNSVASLDPQVTPAGDTARDSEVADFIRYWYVDAMEGGPVIATQEVLYPKLIWKSVVAEKVWYGDLWPRGKFAGKRFYRCFKSKEQAEPVYDEFRNITGVRAQGNGQAETFAPDDFLVLKNWPLFGGPGMSDLRAAYLYLWQLDTAEKLHMIHLEKYLSPVLVASYANGFDADGNLAGLQTDLSKVRARSWLTVPDTVKVEAMQLAMRGEAEFLAKCQDLREQITLSITGAFLQMLTATSGTDMRGSSTVHKSTSELLIWELAARFAGALNSQAIPHLVRENYQGADYPKLSLGGINYAELLDAVKIDEAGQRMGAKFSVRAMSRKYGWQLAQDEADTLQPMPQQPPGFGGMPFSDPPDPEDPRSFCGGPGGKPGPCPQGKGKPAPKGRTPAPDPMHGHPFAGKSREEMVSTLTKQSDPQTAPDNPRGYVTTRYPAGVDGPRFVQSVTSMVGKAQAANPFQRPTLPAVYEAAKAAQPGLTLAAFQASIVKAAKDGAIELGAFTQATSEIPHPEHAIPIYRQKMYYVRIPERRMADAKEFCGGPGSGKPGPCPTGRADEPVGREARRAEMVARVKEGKIPFPIEKRPYKYNFSAFHDAQADRSIPVVMLEPENLVATQDWTVGSKAESIKGELRQDRPILVIRHGGKDYIEEGHHRSIHALVTGQKVPAKILELGPNGKWVPVKQSFADDVALAGSDGAKAEQLLTHAQQQGASVLADLTRTALSRLLRHGEGALAQKRLFTAHERRRLALSLAATLGTSHLLGQARIRRRADQVEKHSDKARRFSDEPTDLRCFDEPLQPMTPTAALDYFRKLVPGISGDPQRFGESMQRQAFTLAVTTDEQLLSKVQGLIAERLETGEGIDTAPAEIDALLEQAGVSPRNDGYARMVYRTNAADAFAEGSQAELNEVADIFPAWQMSNPSDSRSRPEHAERNGRLYPTTAQFGDVRGRDIGDLANCRCVQIPMDRFELEERLAAGEKLETSW